ncbi:hypothetical protein IAR55_000618 [Kwoniella newhampshirensis]|uniref:Uncharacterized protein n=1 Tax=Kwoniella newhampshirensis TaxID=1651941 RepID=A0AAW0Z731_9TREE
MSRPKQSASSSLSVDTSSSIAGTPSLTSPRRASSTSGGHSLSPETLRGRSPSRPPDIPLTDFPPSGSGTGLGVSPRPRPSPSNPFRNEYEYFDTQPGSSSTRRRNASSSSSWRIPRLIMMKRNYMPTPLGYGVIASVLFFTLYLLSSPSPGGITLLPSSWTGSDSKSDPSLGSISPSVTNGDDEPNDVVIPVDEEEEDDHPPLLPLPYAYHLQFPSRTLPKALLTPALYPLASRLVDFLHRPILSHSEAKEGNDAGCPRDLADKLVNPDQYNGDSGFWMDDVTTEEIVRRRADMVRWLEERVDKGEEVLGQDGKTGEGRGIVLTGGNQDTTLRTITAIKHLRRLNVDLPIEVFHYSDELTNQNQRKEIEDLGATLREAKGLEKVEGVWKNWQVRP